MKLFKNILREFAILGVLYAIAFGLALVLMWMFFPERDHLDIWMQGTPVVFDKVRISLLIFITIVCFIYAIRFIFFRPRNLYAGVIAISYMLVAHYCIHIYSPLYVQFRYLTGEIPAYEQETVYNDQGYPVFDDNSFMKMMEHYQNVEQKFKNEILGIQAGVGVVTLLLVFLFVLEIIRRPKKPVVSEHEIDAPAKN